MLSRYINRFSRFSIFTSRLLISIFYHHHHHLLPTMPPRSKHHTHHHPPSSSSPSSISTTTTTINSLPQIYHDLTAIHLDGKTLEGGGQILRLSLCFASLTSRNVLITDIRGNRPRNGGLKSQHLTGVQSLARACKAEVIGGYVGSRNLLFKPNAGLLHNLPPPLSGFIDGNNGGISGEGGSVSGDYTLPWTINDKISITQRTPGSIGLIIQAVLPYILFSPPASSSPSTPSTTVRLSITGGTHVPFSPSYEYIKHVFLPTLSLIGLPRISINLIKHGWTHGLLSVGEVELSIPPLTYGTKLPGFRLENRGDMIVSIELYTRIPLASTNKSLPYAVDKHLTPSFPSTIPIKVHPVADSQHDKRFYALLLAHTSNGYIIASDYLYQHKIKSLEKTIEYLIQTVVKGLKKELEKGGCVDEYLQDQLVVFQALCEGVSFVDGGEGEGSLHTKTARWAASEMFGVEWDGKGGCDGGIGFVAGVGVQEGKDGGEEEVVKVVEDLEGLKVG